MLAALHRIPKLIRHVHHQYPIFTNRLGAQHPLIIRDRLHHTCSNVKASRYREGSSPPRLNLSTFGRKSARSTHHTVSIGWRKMFWYYKGNATFTELARQAKTNIPFLESRTQEPMYIILIHHVIPTSYKNIVTSICHTTVSIVQASPFTAPQYL